jgi:UDPglucose 6-dehydrogenase
MRISVIGQGHVGLVTAACFAHIGHDVLGVDIDQERIESLQRGISPFFEPGLTELVREGLESGKLRFLDDVGEAVRDSEVVFICVGTPPTPTGASDLLGLERLARDIAGHLHEYRLVVYKSTVPVTTGDRVARTLGRHVDASNFDIASNPEFLREGSAIEDTLRPSRIVFGSDSPRAIELLEAVYRPIVQDTGCPVVVTDVRTAELIKHASNAFLATKISFINAIAELCERAGADVEVVAEGMGLDPRIGRAFLHAGVGYGGSCLPKDVSSFVALGHELGCELTILEEVRRINDRGPDRIVAKLRSELWHLDGKTVAVLGVAFKPGTDDLREAPAIRLVEQMLDEGATVICYDPAAMAAAKDVLKGVRFASTPLDAVTDADAVVIMTEWEEFASIDRAALRDAMRLPIVVDGRNTFSTDAMRAAGFTYHSVGRPPVIQ